MKNNKILIVDDLDLNREVLSDIFEDEYDVITAADGCEAIDLIHKERDSLLAVLLDIFMPNKDGRDVLKFMTEEGVITQIPVLMITTDNTPEIEKDCFDLGAMDFIKKPFNSILVKARVVNAISLFSYKNHLEDKVREQTQRLLNTNNAIVEMLGNLVETRNLESGEHVHRVKSYTRELGLKMMELYPEYGLTLKMVDTITNAAALHDVGKIAIPDAILLKPGRLTAEEFEIMKSHTTQGSEYIKNINDIWDKEYGRICYEIAKYHHERFDGRGYPDKLKGDDIPISAQLVSVADVYDALIHVRCYKPAFSRDEAFNMIVNGECGTFSPKLIECFKECYPFENVNDV